MVQQIRTSSATHHINRSKDKHRTILSVDMEKAFDKTQLLVIIFKRILKKIKELYLTLINATYDKPTQNPIKVGKAESFPSKIRSRTMLFTVTTTPVQQRT